MPDWLYKLIDNYLPELLDRSRSALLVHWAFWVTTLFAAPVIIAANPVFGWFVMGAPVLLIWQTRRHGIGQVNGVLLIAAAVMALFPAFFLGQGRAWAKASGESPAGAAIVGFAVLLIWVAAFPAILSRLDERYRRSQLPSEHANEQLPPDDWGELRLLRVRLWIATVIMLAAGEEAAAAVCGLALKFRQRWTAVVASVVCVAFPMLSIRASIVWDYELLEVPAYLFAGYQWLTAARHPLWERGADRPTYR